MTETRIRSDIRTHLSRLFGRVAGALLVEEMEVCAGKARVDMAVICDRLIGIEIKGPRDDLHRLPTQAKNYSKCFDLVVLVVHDSFAKDAIDLIPIWWGIVVGSEEEGSYMYRLIRRPAKNRQVDIEEVLALLWRDEIELLCHKFLATPSSSKASKKQMRKQLISASQSNEVLKAAGIDLLRNRRDWRSIPIA